jgi:hypothetical protein
LPSNLMPLLIGCLGLMTPRLAIVFVVFFSDYIGRAYATTIWPLLGFLFLPLTTLAYAWAMNSRGALEGIQLVAFVIAVLIDLGLFGGSASRRRRARARRERRH